MSQQFANQYNLNDLLQRIKKEIKWKRNLPDQKCMRGFFFSRNLFRYWTLDSEN